MMQFEFLQIDFGVDAVEEEHRIARCDEILQTIFGSDALTVEFERRAVGSTTHLFSHIRQTIYAEVVRVKSQFWKVIFFIEFFLKKKRE